VNAEKNLSGPEVQAGGSIVSDKDTAKGGGFLVQKMSEAFGAHQAKEDTDFEREMKVQHRLEQNRSNEERAAALSLSEGGGGGGGGSRKSSNRMSSGGGFTSMDDSDAKQKRDSLSPKEKATLDGSKREKVIAQIFAEEAAERAAKIAVARAAISAEKGNVPQVVGKGGLFKQRNSSNSNNNNQQQRQEEQEEQGKGGGGGGGKDVGLALLASIAQKGKGKQSSQQPPHAMKKTSKAEFMLHRRQMKSQAKVEWMVVG
jgi:hypothetical protein